MMDRQQQFLWIVQTAIIVNSVNLTIERTPGQSRANVSMTGNWGAITEAIRASQRIPENMSVEEAAHEYCSYMLSNQREAADAASETPMEVPYWFGRS